MTDNNFDPNTIKPFERLINEAGMPTANIIGKALGGIFGTVLYFPAKWGIYTQAHLKDYEHKINNELARVPEENKDSSKLGLLFKEIEDSKYQLNDEMLRSMFSKLISATVDNRKNSNLSPRYPTILSQLGSKDAIFLNKLANNTYTTFSCFRIIKRDTTNNGYSPISPKEIGIDFNIENIVSNDSSLDTLISLGILVYREDASLTSDIATQFYTAAESSNLYLDLKNFQENDNNKIEIKNGLLQFTEFGKQFVKVICQSTFLQ